MNPRLQHAIALLLIAAPWIYFLWIRSSLPASIPVHFGIDGKPDRYGDVRELMSGIIILSAVSLFTYLLIQFLPNLDPKKNASANQDTLRAISLATLALLAVVGVSIVHSATHNRADLITNLVFPAIGLLFAVIGFQMKKVKPNYFFGLRLPWTLESEENWNKTHAYAAPIWMYGGLGMALMMPFLPAKLKVICLLAGTFLMAIIPAIYSYQFFKKQERNQT